VIVCRRARVGSRAIGGVVTVIVALVVLAAPAFAHSVLEQTDPPAGSVLDASPAHITLRFNEPVEISLGAIRLFNNLGHEITTSPSTHPNGNGPQVQVNPPKLANGLYIVAWRVVSADSHPVHGAFTFQVGTGNSAHDPNLVANILASESGNRDVGVALGVARFAAYAALAGLVGGLVLVAVVWPAGRLSRRARMLLWVTVALGVVATLAGIAIQAPYAEGRGLAQAFDPAGWRAVVDTRSGRAWFARALLFGIGGSLLVATLRYVGRWVWRTGAVVLGVALVYAYAESGHGGVGRWPTVGLLSTIAHLSGMAVWLGGLLMLAVVVLPLVAPERALAVVARFSPIAFWSVAVVVTSGLVQAWRQVGSIDALTSTTYGRLLLVKSAAVVVLIGLGAASRKLVQRRLPDPASLKPARAVGAAVGTDVEEPVSTRDDVARGLRSALRKTVGLEVLVAVVVLTITSVLVATAPAISAQSLPFNTTVTKGNNIANITVIPAKTGKNTLHVYIITPGGALQRAQQITVTITEQERDIGPLPVSTQVAGPNHVTTDNMIIPFPGTWQIDVTALFSQFDEETFQAAFTVH
jgi:copper transport protein